MILAEYYFQPKKSFAKSVWQMIKFNFNKNSYQKPKRPRTE